MAMPPGLAKYIASKGNGGKPDAQDPPGSKVDVNPFLKKKKGKKVTDKAKAEAIARKLNSKKG